MIRKIKNTEQDVAERIVAIQQAAYPVEAELMGFHGIPQLHEVVADVQALVGLTWTAAFVGDDIVGLMAWRDSGDSIEIDRLAVDPAWSRRGHGRKLLSALPTSFAIEVSTGSLNLPAVALYESEGFVRTGETEIVPRVFTTQFRREPI